MYVFIVFPNQLTEKGGKGVAKGVYYLNPSISIEISSR